MTDCTKTVGLRFPYSTSINDEPQIFKISYNTALKSNFIEVLLENENNKLNLLSMYLLIFEKGSNLYLLPALLDKILKFSNW